MDWQDELRQYVALQMSSGKSRTEIEQMLLAAGWKREMYGPILQEMIPSAPVPPAAPPVSSRMQPTIPAGRIGNMPSSPNMAGGQPASFPNPKPGIPKMYLLAGAVLLVAIVLGAVLLTQGGGQPKPALGTLGNATQSGQDAASQFQKSLDLYLASPFSIAYDMKSQSIVKAAYVTSNVSIRMNATFYSKAPDAYRIDLMLSKTMEIRMYLLNGTGYSCTKSVDWSCQKYGDAATLGVSLPSRGFAADLAQHPEIKSLAARTIAGVSSSCYSLEIPGSVSGEYCFSSDGALLYAHRFSSIGGNMTNLTMEALSAPLAAIDADFVLPATPDAVPAEPYPTTPPKKGSDNAPYSDQPKVENGDGYTIYYYDSKHGLPRDHVNCVSETDTVYLTFPDRVMKWQGGKFVEVGISDMTALAQEKSKDDQKFFKTNLTLTCFVNSAKSGQWLLYDVSMNGGVIHKTGGSVEFTNPDTTFADTMFEDKAGRIWVGNIGGMESVNYYENGKWLTRRDQAPYNMTWVNLLGYDKSADRVYVKAHEDLGDPEQFWYFNGGKWTRDPAFGIKESFGSTASGYVASGGFSYVRTYSRGDFNAGPRIDIASNSGWVLQVLVDKNGDAWVTGKNSFDSEDGVARVHFGS